MATPRSRPDIERDIQDTLGLVPSFFKRIPDEYLEAVHYAKMSVGWSVYLNGMQQDYDQFAEELGRIGTYLTEHATAEDEQPSTSNA